MGGRGRSVNLSGRKLICMYVCVHLGLDFDLTLQYNGELNL